MTGNPIGLEAKWQTPNLDKSTYKIIETNMAITGCGFLIPKDFYWELGGADERLPKMGAIGEEFAIKAWLGGGKVQTRTDVMVGHIFGTGGYSTDGTRKAQRMLYDMYGDRYNEIADKFPDWEGVREKPTIQISKGEEQHIFEWKDVQTAKHPDTGNIMRIKTTNFRYVWYNSEHPEEDMALSIEQKRAKSRLLAGQVGEPIVEYPEN